MILVDMVVFHGRQERDFHTQPPEENGGVEFKLFCQIAPFLRIVGEDTGEHTHGDGDCFSYNLRCKSVNISRKIQVEETYSSCPQGQPDDFQPNRKPEQFDTPDTGIGEGQSTHKQWINRSSTTGTI